MNDDNYVVDDEGNLVESGPLCHWCVKASEKVDQIRLSLNEARDDLDNALAILEFATTDLARHDALAEEGVIQHIVDPVPLTVYSINEFLSKDSATGFPKAVFSAAQRKTVTKAAALAAFDRGIADDIHSAYIAGDFTAVDLMKAMPLCLLDAKLTTLYVAQKSTSMPYLKEDVGSLAFTGRHPVVKYANVVLIDTPMAWFALKEKGRSDKAQRTVRGMANLFVDRLFGYQQQLESACCVYYLEGEFKEYVTEAKQ